MGNKNAFALLELLLYCACSLVLIGGIFTFFASTQNMLAQQIRFRENTVRMCVVLDMLKRDVMSASYTPHDWSQIDKNTQGAILFKKERVDQAGQQAFVCVSWQAVPDGVKRVWCDYDLVTKKWVKKQTDYFPCSMTKLVFRKKHNARNTRVIGVYINYCYKRDTQIINKPREISKTEYIRLRNGELL